MAKLLREIFSKLIHLEISYVRMYYTYVHMSKSYIRAYVCNMYINTMASVHTRFTMEFTAETIIAIMFVRMYGHPVYARSSSMRKKLENFIIYN